MLMRIHALLLISAVYFSGVAWALPRNPRCLSASLHSLKTLYLENFHEGDLDYCTLSNEEMPEAISVAIDQIASFHKKAADLFGVSVHELLPFSVDVIMEGNKTGSADMYAYRGPEVHFTVFPDWNGEKLDEAGYLHELGHILSRNVLPPIVGELDGTLLFSETFPDFLPLAILGNIFTPQSDLPDCLNHIHEVTLTDSFNSTAGKFDEFYTLRKAKTCCDQLKESENLNLHAQWMCDAYNRALSERGLPAEDFSPFQAESCLNPLPGNKCDPHRLALPINSFLMSLGFGFSSNNPFFNLLNIALGPQRIYSLYLSALLQASYSTDLYDRYSCQPKFSLNSEDLNSEDKRRVEVIVPSYELVFQLMRKALTPEWQQIFDQEWKNHGMDEGMNLARLTALAKAKERAAGQMGIDPRLFQVSCQLVSGSW